MKLALKPFVQMNADETLVAQELQRRFPKGNIFTAIKDVGIDLLLIPDLSKPKTVRIQVKGSKFYTDGKTEIGKGWISLKKERIEQYKKMCDFIIFVIWEYEMNIKGKPAKLIPYFIIIPTKKFAKIVYEKKIEHGIGYSFYFERIGKTAYEVRDETRKGRINLSQYLNSWSTIK